MNKNKIKIKKGDRVKLLTGKDKDKVGQILNVFINQNKVTIKGVNVQKKHIKPSKSSPSGGIVELNGKVDISNVAIICSSCGKNSRVRYNIDKKSKIRICSKCKKSLETSEK